MKAGLITLVVLAMAGGLSGCGQKGPLYPDAPVNADVVSESVSGQSSDSEEDRSR